MKTRAQALEQFLVNRCLRVHQCVEVPRPILTHFDEIRPSQIGQMSRNRRLWERQTFDEVTHAEFTPAEQMQDAQSHGIRERLEHQVDTSFGCGGHPDDSTSSALGGRTGR